MVEFAEWISKNCLSITKMTAELEGIFSGKVAEWKKVRVRF